MMLANGDATRLLVNSVLMFVAVGGAVWIGLNPLLLLIARKEKQYDIVLRRNLLMDIQPRMVTVLTGAIVVLLGFIGYSLLNGSLIGMAISGAIGLLLPGAVVKLLARKRREKLESQLVGGVQTLASGVRAGLNLVQSMQMVASDGPQPLCQEFAHLVQEYEYGVPVDEAMSNASKRIGSADFRLLFAALHTHREQGGDLGETLDRIAESIREIQRLENRVQSLTAQGRATARWLGAMPAVVMCILYVIDSEGVIKLFSEGIGNLILAVVVVLNIIGFLWIRKIMNIDI